MQLLNKNNLSNGIESFKRAMAVENNKFLCLNKLYTNFSHILQYGNLRSALLVGNELFPLRILIAMYRTKDRKKFLSL